MGLALGTSVLVLFAQAVGAQVAPWAIDRALSLDDVEITADYPPGDSHAGGQEIVGAGRRVTIFGSGEFEVRSFAGETHVSHSDKPLARSDVYDLLNSFLAVQFFDLPDEFKGGARAVPLPTRSQNSPSTRFQIKRGFNPTDATYVDLTLRIESHSKRIRCWYGASPESVMGISKRIRKAVGLPDD
jgi:hypothetical protein